MTEAIAGGGDELKLRATDVLLSVLQHDAGPLRDFLERQPDHRLMQLLLATLAAVKDGGVQEQVRRVWDQGLQKRQRRCSCRHAQAPAAQYCSGSTSPSIMPVFVVSGVPLLRLPPQTTDFQRWLCIYTVSSLMGCCSTGIQLASS